MSRLSYYWLLYPIRTPGPRFQSLGQNRATLVFSKLFIFIRIKRFNPVPGHHSFPIQQFAAAAGACPGAVRCSRNAVSPQNGGTWAAAGESKKWVQKSRRAFSASGMGPIL